MMFDGVVCTGTADTVDVNNITDDGDANASGTRVEVWNMGGICSGIQISESDFTAWSKEHLTLA